MPQAKDSSEAFVTTATDKLHADLSDCRRRVEALVDGLTADQLTQRPEPGKWSIAECLAHLNLTAAVVQPKIAATIEQGKQEKAVGTRPCSPGPLGRLLMWMAEPPPKFRLRAPKSIAPPVPVGDPTQVISDFMKVQDDWEKLARDADRLNQKKLKISSPFRGLPRLRLAAPIPWMMAHQRRHLLQAEKVKRRVQAGAVAP